MTKSKVKPTDRWSVYFMGYDWGGNYGTREEALKCMESLYDDPYLNREISQLDYIGKSPKDFLSLGPCDADSYNDWEWENSK